ncbi:hypothetical protein [uncultured Sphaerochaeta sp.]|uniref:hypothetical protein n=1 Tax=uncultured Sphaerochaeta sp. TaxID=886478 RepID=UPI002A0A87E7|nr:hypothetical protein [uncultured Sphaerochaeta sp.]
MKYKAEIFDKVQYLYEKTKFNDHQLHCVIRFNGKLNIPVLKKSVMLLLQVIPILSCVYRHDDGNDYWESVPTPSIDALFHIVYEKDAFEHFTTSKTDAFTGPQILFCLYRTNEKDALSIIMNHMIGDGAGFKQCLYLFSNLYSNLLENSRYVPNFTISGERGFQGIIQQIPFKILIKSMLFHNKESNQDSSLEFPLSKDMDIFPFILTRELDSEKFMQIRTYCKRNQITINDVFLAAYHRALLLEIPEAGNILSLPLMVDMRRYLQDKNFRALTNLSSTSIIHIPIKAEESFDDTVYTIHRMVKNRKHDIGVNGFVKLNMGFKFLSNKSSYKLTKKALRNPPICMTNIGILDDTKLVFSGTEIEDAFICGSIKYRPHFQIAISSFKDTLTISSNLYGSRQDYETIAHFLFLVEKQLPLSNS